MMASLPNFKFSDIILVNIHIYVFPESQLLNVYNIVSGPLFPSLKKLSPGGTGNAPVVLVPAQQELTGREPVSWEFQKGTAQPARARKLGLQLTREIT